MTFLNKSFRSVRYFGATAVVGGALLSAGLLHGQATTSSTSPTNQAAAPAGPPSGCTLKGKTYSCNIGLFRRILRQAKTVAVEGGPKDTAVVSQLTELAQNLHKPVVDKGQNPDLYFVVLPIDSNGIVIGPNDTDLATLRVYATAPEGGHGQLLWSETYRGQADRAWALTVRALVQQFEDRLQQHRS
jgi:hypothetical protein